MLAYRRALDGYALVLRNRLATARTTEEAVKNISTLLFGEVGLRGNGAEYYNPENSYLNCVLDLKRGIPISLATVFLLTARRLSVAVEGVGMPQHFLLKYRGSTQEVFVDVFHGGKLLTARDCARFLADAQVAFNPDYLRAVSDREMLTRILGNLLRIYHSVEDQRRYDRVSAMLKLLS
jgi:regulator of sirC expression with transglutaminase-like and TPR domain